jgi:pyrimidine operon attenuation protein/uracil phosphoribosyltransferase
VVAEHALCLPGLHPGHDQVAHGRAVRAAIAQVAHEGRPAPVRVLAVRAVPQVADQVVEGPDLAMYVADHVERSVEQTGLRTV